MPYLKKSEISALEKFVRFTNYLTVAQIYLRDNFLLRQPLRKTDVKPRLLGHWGTCPGINFVYAHTNRLIKKSQSPFLIVVGPGHGFPAVQANLFLEGSLSKHYPQTIPYSTTGIAEICHNFSAPYGYPSHANPAAPGIILEGGELGYSLSISWGSVLDNPELITVCLIGDGEAETGPLAAAWQINKLVSPKTNGAVLPILHLNGYKISGPTVYGRMSDTELQKYFEGLGYEPYFVDHAQAENVHTQMAVAMDTAYGQIRAIQKAARSRQGIECPRWPVIILRTPKGWTGPQKDGPTKLEDNCKSHQVVVAEARTKNKDLKKLENWLKSYNFGKLAKNEKDKLVIDQDIKSLLPPLKLRTGLQHLAYGGDVVKNLRLPLTHKLSETLKYRGKTKTSPMHKAGEYLRDVLKNNTNLRIFSPDETYSNRIQAVFETTNRSWQWPLRNWDENMSREGKVMELLSEHTMLGLLHGYTVTGRHGLFVSYESFCQIIASMADQYAKFIKASQGVTFRKPLPALNIILTSLLERQDHNGFSHQNPSFISSMLEKDGELISAYFPPDANSMLATLRTVLRSRNQLNLIVAGKQMLPVWLSEKEASRQTKNGILTWNFASDENPDIVLVACGDYVVQESLAAIQIAKELLPHLRIRFVCVSELSALGVGDPTVLHNSEFLDQYFTADKPVIFNFHGYAHTIKKMLFDYTGSHRVNIRGYHEEGSTTTPFDMETRNQTSRYHLVRDLATLSAEIWSTSEKDAEKVQKIMVKKLLEHKNYILEYGIDPAEITDWQWQNLKNRK